MNEQQVEQVERLAERLGLDGVAELAAEWRALKAAGLALAENAVNASEIDGDPYCIGCGWEYIVAHEHATDCPTRAFVQP